MKMGRLFRVAVAVPLLAMAGGSFEPVKVTSLERLSDTDYELVVAPGQTSDPYMTGCAKFTVRGTYSSANISRYVTRAGHLAALSRLQRALDAGEVVNFGWMGPGFEPDPSNRCIVKSRGLEYIFDNGKGIVLSYYGAI